MWFDTALAAGDRRLVVNTLMDRYGDSVYRFAVAMTHDRALSEEIRQQVFVEAHRDLGNLAPGSSVTRWLFGIVRHRCLDAVNARARWNERYKNEMQEEPEDDCDLDRELDRVRLARILEECLMRLAPAARAAVVLRYQQELSYEEVAEIAGDLPGTLQRRVARALPVLRRCVQASLGRGECDEL